MNQVEPVHIVVEGGGGVFWMAVLWWSLALAGVVLAAWVALKLAPRVRRDPLATAFSKLARHRGLSAEERADVRAAAAHTGIPAAVLLVSAGARAEATRPGLRAQTAV